MKAKVFNKFQTLRQKIRSFRNFIDKFKRLILETEKILNNKIRKTLYKKALKKKLILVSINIDNNASFEVYKTQLITINNHLTQYKSNFNEITYNAISKTEYSDSALESTGGNIIK